MAPSSTGKGGKNCCTTSPQPSTVRRPELSCDLYGKGFGSGGPLPAGDAASPGKDWNSPFGRTPKICLLTTVEAGEADSFHQKDTYYFCGLRQYLKRSHRYNKKT